MRDRLAELKAKTGEEQAKSEVIDMEPGPDSNDSFMAEFFVAIGTIRDDIAELEKLIKSISEKHGQVLAAISEKQGQQTTLELDQLQDNAQRISNRVRNKLKAIDKENKALDKASEGSANGRIRKSQHATLSRKFVDVMNVYNDTQTAYKQKYQERVRRQFKIVKPDATAEEIQAVVEGEPTNVFAQQIMSKSHAEVKQALEDIQDRHKDILKLEKSIKELHELFVDMAILVEAQGEMIDRIEFNVSESTQYVEEAVIELKAAHRLQTSARRKQMYITICIIILILIIAVPIALKFK
eukprot:Sdes_comp20539_c0_seq2m15235